MKGCKGRGQQVLVLGMMGCLSSFLEASNAQTTERDEGLSEIRVLQIQTGGTLEISLPGSTTWILTTTGQVLHPFYRVRTGLNTRAVVRWSDRSVVTMDALTELEILPPDKVDSLFGINFVKGILSFFHRDKPGRIRMITRGAAAGIRGTELVLEVDRGAPAERTTLSVIDGIVEFSNDRGSLVLTNNQRAVAEVDKAPIKGAGIIANNVLQWCFYYPAILDLRELPLTPAEEALLAHSLTAYREGDPVRALSVYPGGRTPDSDAERIYYAALQLSVGRVGEAEAALASLRAGAASDHIQRLAFALRQLIAAVKRQPMPSKVSPQLSTELLAASYYEQSLAVRETSLRKALDLARLAVTNSPRFGFAWTRVAELEFSFGRLRQAEEAFERGYALSPRNPEALALEGFLLAAQNKTSQAIEWFDYAIAADSTLGNAWLGRGLCRIHGGDLTAGQEDLLVAAAMEPQRALLRSYLGKAYGQAGDYPRAAKDLSRAKDLDPGDPTAWLYSALLNQQENLPNQAIGDLERSEQLNENRRVFRSGLLLDQDRAVRSANLASIYRDDGMTEVSVREAARAVMYDYANDSAHLFLSDSYNELRDPTRFNLRYETVWFNELLLANLLSPVGGGRLSQQVSQQEYSKLFEADGLHLANSTVARTDGMVTELASQFGTLGMTSYALDLDYQRNDGVRANNDLSDIEWYTTIKQQITPQDTALGLIKYEDYHSGDNFQYYDPDNQLRKHFRFDEYQHPILVGAWHHEWSPGIHTLVLGGRLENEQHFSDQAVPQILLTEFSNGSIAGAAPGAFDIDYQNRLEVYDVEINQICQWDRITLTMGGRYQAGRFNARALLDHPSGSPGFFFDGTPTNSSSSDGFERLTGYGYLTVEPVEAFYVTSGLAGDDLTFPHNFRNPPIASGEDRRAQLGPKAALVWSPVPQAALRGVFTRSLGGVSLDESYRLEPTQLAGFPQAFRTLISESVVGSVAAPEYETFGLALDLKFPTGTFAGVQAERLESNVRRTIGVFSLINGNPPFEPESTLERLDYRENSLNINLNQLMGDMFVAGVSYSFDQARLHDVLPNVPTTALSTADLLKRGNLHQTAAYILFNHPSGLFARAETHWYHQSNSGGSTPEPGDDFFQHNLFAGYRFAQHRVELLLGLLNLTDRNYRLDPLTVYAELPRGRTFVAQLKFQF